MKPAHRLVMWKRPDAAALLPAQKLSTPGRPSSLAAAQGILYHRVCEIGGCLLPLIAFL